MGHPAELEAHLRASPDDVEAWQVYADWLRDEGDPRADAILAGAPVEAVAPDLDPIQIEGRFGFVLGLRVAVGPQRYDDARDRGLRELGRFLASRESRLLATLSVRFAVIGGSDDFEAPNPSPPIDLDHFRALCRLDLTRIRTLYLGGNALTGALSALAAARMPELRDLDLRLTGLVDADLADLAAAPWLTGLHRLSLADDHLTADGLGELLREPRQWRELDLRDSGLGPAGARLVADTPHLPHLRALVARPDELGAVGMAALAASPHLPPATRRFWSALCST